MPSMMVKIESRKADLAKDVSSKRKRRCKHINNVVAGVKEIGENDDNPKNKEENSIKPMLDCPSNGKKRKKNMKRPRSSESKKPLAGMTISVSTLSDNTKSQDCDDTETAPKSYSEVCRLCKELGADFIDLVCKRVDVLICSEAAVKQATQRVRKAIKRGKPLVSVAWLEQCRRHGRKVDIEEYRLDDIAEAAVQSREDRQQIAEEKFDESNVEAIPDSGWSEPKDLGCCCVCHENGTTADCPWCVDCPSK